MSYYTATLIVAIGACIGLLCVELNDESKLHFGLPAILWGFLMTSALGMMAGSSLGFETVQISSGADPDYESIKVREVSDSERWNTAHDVGNEAFLLIGLGLLISYGVILLLNHFREEHTAEGKNALRTNAGILLVIAYFVMFNQAFEG